MARVIASGIFLITKDDKLLICHPTNHSPTFWSIPKGKVEEGESYKDAAIRETFEETNIDLSRAILEELTPVVYKHKKKALYPFICREVDNPHLNWGGFEIKCNSNVPKERGGFPEMDAYKYCSIEEAEGLLHETQVICLKKLKEKTI